MEYIVLLRGINVGGHKKVKMEDLRKVLESAGYINVKTYIQSGNILLETQKESDKKLASDISKLMLEHFGFEVPVLARTIAEWAKIAEDLPFEELLIEFLHITLLDELPDQKAVDAIDRSKFNPNEKWQVIGKTVYLYCPDGYGRTKLTNEFWEKKLGSAATTRNWKTLLALMEMVENRSDSALPAGIPSLIKEGRHNGQ